MWKNTFILLSLVLYTLQSEGGYIGGTVTLFQHTNFQGTSRQVYAPMYCVNVPSDFNDVASSVDTHENCARFFVDKDCTGRSIKLWPGNDSHNNLVVYDMNDKISSLWVAYRGVDVYC